MDTKDLEQLSCLNKEIERQKKYLMELESSACCGASSRITGQPRARQILDRTGELASKIEDLKSAILKNVIKSFREKRRIEELIHRIDDSEIRLIVRLRHVNCFSWEEIAAELATFDSEGNIARYPNRTTVMRRYKNYLKKF